MNEVEDRLSFSPLFTKILAARGITSAELARKYLSANLEDLKDPFLMKGMKEAKARILSAITNSEKILIHGDYDVDGVTSSAILLRTLGILGASAEVFLPERDKDGYGVSERAIREAAQKGIRLLITADCGITAHHQLNVAEELEVDVIIIDHHRIPSEGLPHAFAILNPQQSDCDYPFKELSAGGLAFKLSQALLGDQALQFLDLASLSTVCDVAPLMDENRIIVKHGLVKLSNTDNQGLKSLSRSANIRTKTLNVGHLGFILGPRINACGRMSTPDTALRLLSTSNERESDSLATVLEEENKERQREERQTTKEAIQEVERTVNFSRDRIIIIGKEGWHQGVIGIVASRLVDKYNRPAVVIAFEDGVGKGSGRSIKGINLFEAIDPHSQYLEEFGGHAQALGLKIQKENLSVFRKAVNEKAASDFTPDQFVRKTAYDLEISLTELSSVFINELKQLEPHGAGNARPVFHTQGLQVKTNPTRVTPQMIKFWVTDGIMTFEAVWTDKLGRDLSWIKQGVITDMIYAIKTRFWNGREQIALDIKHAKEIV